MLNDKETARKAIESCTYPDTGGRRGQGPIRAIHYGFLDEEEYIRTADQRVFKIFQIESLEGYENLDEIMDVQGVDSLFIGAADLGRSICGHKEIDQTLEKVYDDICKRVKKRGITLGAAVSPEAQSAKTAMEKGINWVVFGQDTRILAEGLKNNLDKLRDF